MEEEKVAGRTSSIFIGNLRFASSIPLAVGRREVALEIRGICHRKIQQRSAEVLEHLSHREKRAAARTPEEALPASGYQGKRRLRNRSANRQAGRGRRGNGIHRKRGRPGGASR